ncbi:MAG: hypothetical protein ACRD9R_17730 [Pyrinomonadaceae bacterium]
MALTKEDVVRQAKNDLARRLGVNANEVKEDSVEAADFPDAALGAPVTGEMSAQMITPGWRVRLRADGKAYEYRACRNGLRLYNFKGANHRV